MRRLSAWGLILALFLPSGVVGQPPAPPSSTTSPYDRSWAVIIGISKYNEDSSKDPLPYAVKDARAMARALKAHGFTLVGLPAKEPRRAADPEFPELLLDEDATKAHIYWLIDVELKKQLRANDRAIIFFAGHGEERTREESGRKIDEGFLLPYDFKPQTYTTAINMTEIRDNFSKFDEFKAKHMLFLIDACYLGLSVPGFEYRGDPPPDWARLAVTRPVRQIITAGSEKQRVVEDSTTGGGVFTKELLKALDGDAPYYDGVITAKRLAQHLGDKVYVASGQAHRPLHRIVVPGGDLSRYRLEEFGDMVFLQPRRGEPPRPDVPAGSDMLDVQGLRAFAAAVAARPELQGKSIALALAEGENLVIANVLFDELTRLEKFDVKKPAWFQVRKRSYQAQSKNQVASDLEELSIEVAEHSNVELLVTWKLNWQSKMTVELMDVKAGKVVVVRSIDVPAALVERLRAAGRRPGDGSQVFEGVVGGTTTRGGRLPTSPPEGPR